MPWWYHLAKRIWDAMKWLTTTIVIVFFVGYAANIAAVQWNQVSDTFLIHETLWLFQPSLQRFVFFGGVGGLACITLIARLVMFLAGRLPQFSPSTKIEPSSTVPKPPMNPGERERLVKLVKKVIEDLLKRSSLVSEPIPLRLNEYPDAITFPGKLFVERADPEQSYYPLPEGTSITTMFRNANDRMLILGEPGSGKTTLLLELARDLLKEEHSIDKLIPVYFHLATWAQKTQPLTHWLVEELRDQYSIPLNTASSWVENEYILPLLDGLDEVTAERREDCILKINEFLQHNLLSLVLCSRKKEYSELHVRARLQTAVVVQPLTEKQIEHYLANRGASLRPVYVAWQQDAELRKLTTTPLMLTVLTLAYQSKPLKRSFKRHLKIDNDKSLRLMLNACSIAEKIVLPILLRKLKPG